MAAWGAIAVGTGGLFACSATSVSAGAEGDTINLARCYAIDCGSAPQSILAKGAEAEPCLLASTPLVGEPFEPHGLPLSVRALVPAPDGSVWLLAFPTQDSNSAAEPVLMRYSSEGSLLGVSEPFRLGTRQSNIEARLAVDAEGNALVAVYGVYAETADSEVVERLNLYTIGPDLAPIGAPVPFRGISLGHPAPSPQGGVIIAGNALNNRPHGVITHLVEAEPEWIQTRLTAGGQSVIGVTDLVVDEAGVAAVLAQRQIGREGAISHSTFGVTLFDAHGAPLGDIVLPTHYEAGYHARMARQGEDFVVTAVTRREELMVRHVARDGSLGWAFTLRGMRPSVAVGAETGRSFVHAAGGIAAIAADGSSCAILPLAVPSQGPAGVMAVHEPYLFSATLEGVMRYTLPVE